jgi:hypothetical protein
MAETVIFQATDNTETITFELMESGEAITVYLNEQARGPSGTGGGGGASSWNDLTGTANDIPFDTTPTSVPTGAGVVSWNADDNTLDIQTGLGGVTLQVGQEQHIKARNNSGAAITNGSVVYLSGASGQRPTIALADADSDAHVASTIGLTTADIGNNSFGMVTTSGMVRGVNTAGMTEGGPIYLSGTAGAFTQTAPTSNVVRVGWCIVAGNNGTVLVHVEKMSVKASDIKDWNDYDLSVNSVATTNYLAVNPSDTSSDFRAFSVTQNQLQFFAPNALGNLELTTVSWPEVAAGSFDLFWPTASGTFALTTQSDGSITTADVTGLDTALSGKQATLVSGTNIKTINGSSLLGSGDLTVSVSFANPTATIGLTAVNGSASTAMRSDAAPALDQSIAPTWTASHTYSQSIAAGDTLAAVTLVNPTDAASGNQRWSPAMVWSGKGFSTTGGLSTDVSFRSHVVPIQGATATGRLTFEFNNAGTWQKSVEIGPRDGGLYLYSTTGVNALRISGFGNDSYFDTGVSAGRVIFRTSGTTRTNLTLNASGSVHSDLSGRISIGSTDMIVGRRAAANFQLGNDDAASPVAQTMSVQSVSTGTSNGAGASRNYDGSQGTGSGLGGAHVFRVATAGSSGTTQNSQQTALRIEQDRSVFVANVSTEPATPSGGGVFYVEAGALKYKGSSGTVTTIANA